MSSYGPPPGGGYPPQEPGPPIDPWGQPAYPSSPGYGPPQGYPTSPSGYPGYQPTQPPWTPQPPPPQKNSRQTVLIVVIVVLALLLGIAGFTAFWLTNRDRPGTAAPGPSESATSAPTSTAQPPTSAATGDFRTVAKGQCVVNDGTEKDPKLRIVPCAKNTLVVLERINATTDRTKCSAVKGYEYFFYYDSTLDTLDFVLCMKKSS